MTMTAERRPEHTRPARRRRKREKDTPEIVKGVCRLIRSAGNRIGTEDPEQLEYLRWMQDELDAAWERSVAGIRRSGFTDQEIADVIGLRSRQAVAQRWPRKNAEQPS